jgi:hypothetical protein
MRHIGVGERRARLGVRHRLAHEARAGGVVEVARDLVALHGTDPASAVLSALLRSRGTNVAAFEHALYEQRSLVRLLGMRRTVFVVPTELVGVVQASSTSALYPGERRKAVRFIEDGGLAPDGGAWLRDVEDATVEALRARGQATAAELGEDVPGLREQVFLDTGKPYDAPVRMSTRVLFLLAAEGRIVRGRPIGSWISSQYRWAPAETWLPGGVPDLPVGLARAELVRRWLATFGPGTLTDLKWWTGWGVRDVRTALTAVGAVEVALDGATGLVLPDDLEPVPAPAPWVALLPALDPTPMGWAERGWYLGEHRAALFDRTGNIGPTVWSDGRIVGGWAQRKDGEIAFRLLEDVGAETVSAVEAAAADLTRTLGDTRVTPRFRTPLERELAA